MTLDSPESGGATSGGLVLWKPVGFTSRAALVEVQRTLDLGRLGHAGTLDPLACGLLILLVGEGRKFQNLFTAHIKEYEARIVLGMGSGSEDGEGPLWSVVPRPVLPDAERIATVAAGFVGEYRHVPPRFSAVRIQGQRSHRRARRGEVVEPAPRTVTLHAVEMISWRAPVLRLRVRCDAGTYVRSLARDLGDALGVGAFLAGLRRTRIGEFGGTDAVSLKEVARGHWMSLEALLRHEPAVEVTPEDVRRLGHGQQVPAPETAAGAVVVWCQGRVRGLAQVRDAQLHARRWLKSESAET